MKAIVRDAYGTVEVLRFEDVDKPIPGDDDVLVEVRAASVNTADLDQLTGRPRLARVATGLGNPRSRFLGLDMTGVVEAVGRNVTRFQPGEEVWADLFSNGAAAFAEYVCARESAFHPKPPGLTFEQAATLPHSGLLALQGLDARGGITPGDHVLINGAGGCVGPFAIQIAKARGAVVTAVDHTDKLAMMSSLGADHVIDFTREDFAKGSARYDFILDIAARRTLVIHRRALAAGGVYVQVARTLGGFFRAAVGGAILGVGTSKRMGLFMWEANRRRDLDRLADMVVRGEVAPLIDGNYPLSAVPDAMRRLHEGKARGKLVIIP